MLRFSFIHTHSMILLLLFFQELRVQDRTVSLWTYVLHEPELRKRCTNALYHPAFYFNHALYPNVSGKKLVLWDDFWFHYLPHEAYGGLSFNPWL